MQLLRFCISNQLPGGAHTAGLGTHFENQRSRTMVPVWLCIGITCDALRKHRCLGRTLEDSYLGGLDWGPLAIFFSCLKIP